MSEYILEMNHITKAFSGVKALDDVNLKVKKGEIMAICGENGAGKSTLMNVLSGIYPHGEYEGDIIYNGEVCQFRNIRESEAKGIVIIHQELALSPYLSVAENVFIGNERLKSRGIIDWTTTRREAKALLARVGLAEKASSYPCRLSGGQQQRVAIARALCMSPDILCFDEPTSALDPELTGEVLSVIRGLKSHDSTMIVVTHEMEFARSVADRVIFMANGIIEEEGTPDEVFGNPKSPILQGFLHKATDMR